QRSDRRLDRARRRRLPPRAAAGAEEVVAKGVIVQGNTAIRWWPIVLCALSVLLDGYDAQMLAMAIPLMAKEFGVAPVEFAPAASASLAGMAIGALLLSPLADRFGRRPLLILSLVLFGAPTLFAMHSGGPFELTLWRLLAGCGLGATVPVTI